MRTSSLVINLPISTDPTRVTAFWPVRACRVQLIELLGVSPNWALICGSSPRQQGGITAQSSGTGTVLAAAAPAPVQQAAAALHGRSQLGLSAAICWADA